MTDPFIPERAVICPYNSTHSIAESRIQKHLIKCRQNYPPDYKVSCPYNETHKLFKHEVEKHIATCPDHQPVDPAIYEYHRNHGSVKSSCANPRNLVECTESWENEESDVYEVPKTPALPVSETMRPPSRRDRSPGGSKRAPTGLAEALMIEESGDSAVEDMDSVASFMGLGRGRAAWSACNRSQAYIMKIGHGRGSGQLLDM